MYGGEQDVVVRAGAEQPGAKERRREYERSTRLFACDRIDRSGVVRQVRDFEHASRGRRHNRTRSLGGRHDRRAQRVVSLHEGDERALERRNVERPAEIHAYRQVVRCRPGMKLFEE